MSTTSSVHVCVPVLRRYDLLRNLSDSLTSSTVRPDELCVVNNGRDEARLLLALQGAPCSVVTYTPPEPLGVAESWNWFLANVDEERIIANDDVTFAPESIAALLASQADLVWAGGCGFSCFVLRDACIEKVGFFDETISPGYGYYEDEDYLQRLDGRGTRAPSAVAEEVACGVVHERSATLKAATQADLAEHHRRFKLAQANYARKWHLEGAFR